MLSRYTGERIGERNVKKKETLVSGQTQVYLDYGQKVQLAALRRRAVLGPKTRKHLMCAFLLLMG